jgi:hypothetical protein
MPDQYEVVMTEVPVDETRIRQRSDSWIDVPQVSQGMPIQLRPGTEDGDVQILIHTTGPNGSTGVMVEVRAADLRVGVDAAEVMD